MFHTDIYKLYRSPSNKEGNFPPSCVEPCHNLSLGELLRDYTLGITHPERNAYYDEGDSMEEPLELSDLSDLDSLRQQPIEIRKNSKPSEEERSDDKQGEENLESSSAPVGVKGESSPSDES